jgi:hypothetical protein
VHVSRDNDHRGAALRERGVISPTYGHCGPAFFCGRLLYRSIGKRMRLPKPVRRLCETVLVSWHKLPFRIIWYGAASRFPEGEGVPELSRRLREPADRLRRAASRPLKDFLHVCLLSFLPRYSADFQLASILNTAPNEASGCHPYRFDGSCNLHDLRPFLTG